MIDLLFGIARETCYFTLILSLLSDFQRYCTTLQTLHRAQGGIWCSFSLIIHNFVLNLYFQISIIRFESNFLSNITVGHCFNILMTKKCEFMSYNKLLKFLFINQYLSDLVYKLLYYLFLYTWSSAFFQHKIILFIIFIIFLKNYFQVVTILIFFINSLLSLNFILIMLVK